MTFLKFHSRNEADLILNGILQKQIRDILAKFASLIFVLIQPDIISTGIAELYENNKLSLRLDFRVTPTPQTWMEELSDE